MRPVLLPVLIAAFLLSLPDRGAAQVSWDRWIPPEENGDEGAGAENEASDWDEAAVDWNAGAPPLRCTGTEPFWSLDVAQGRATLEQPDARRTVWATEEAEPVANRSDHWVLPLRTRPGGAVAGYAVVERTGACSDGMSDRTYPYEILLIGRERGPAAGCCSLAMAEPEVTVNPQRAAPGEMVTVAAEGLPSNTDVTIQGGPPNGTVRPLLPARTDAQGAVRAEVPVPRAAEGRDEYVFSVRTARDGTTIEAEPIQVAGGGADGRLSVTGTISSEGVECPALRGDDGQLYTLAGTGARELRPGDRVEVTGVPAEMSICMQGTTIDVRSIDRIGG